VTVYHLGQDLNREIVGLGSMVTPQKDHEGITKRPTETLAAWRIEPTEQILIPEEQKSQIKRELAKILLELNQTENYGKVRKQALALRREVRKYLSPEEILNASATVAVLLCLESSEIDTNLSTEDGNLIIRNGDISRRFVVETEEGHEINVTSFQNAYDPEKLIVGDDLFNVTTGQPHADLKRKLMEVL